MRRAKNEFWAYWYKSENKIKTEEILKIYLWLSAFEEYRVYTIKYKNDILKNNKLNRKYLPTIFRFFQIDRKFIKKIEKAILNWAKDVELYYKKPKEVKDVNIKICNYI